MADIVCDTTVIQYLHQLKLLHILPALGDGILIPPAVDAELAEGRRRGYDVPDPSSIGWLAVRRPSGTTALPSTPHIGAGEREVLELTMEHAGLVAILDDGLARDLAESLNLPMKGTLGLLLDAKRAGLIPLVAPVIDALQALSFRLSKRTREAVLRLAGEA